jgi:hypothetical protein
MFPSLAMLTKTNTVNIIKNRALIERLAELNN